MSYTRVVKKIFLITLILITGVFVYLFITKQILPEHSSFIPPLPGTESAPIKMSAGQVPDIDFSLPEGFSVHVFATGLNTARDLVFTPGGTLLVSDPSTGSVVALPDKNGDGVADEVKTILSNQDKAHGMAFFKDKLYVAGVDRVVMYSFDEAGLTASLDRELFTLPRNSLHDKRAIAFNSQGQMFVSVPSSCNVCNQDQFLGGSVIVSDMNGKKPIVYAQGLRNSPFFAVDSATDEIWATEMGRDYLGDDLPPDEINIISDGKNYGWPNCYSNKIWDKNFNKDSSDPCINTVSPIFEIPAHSAPLGLVFINSKQFPEDWQGDLLVAYHGSWNRSTPAGFKVVHANVEGKSINGADDFMTGFQQGKNAKSAFARPVDLIFDKAGNLYISDDKGGNVFIIQKQ